MHVDADLSIAKNPSSLFFSGEDFDQRIMEYFIKLIKKKHGKDASSDVKAVQKLRREAERAKALFVVNQHQVRVEIESLYDGIDFSEPLTRARFEELNNDLFRKTMGPVRKAMEDAGMKKTQIDEIVLCRGLHPNTQSASATERVFRWQGTK